MISKVIKQSLMTEHSLTSITDRLRGKELSMTKNYWVKAALHRKKASSEEVLVDDATRNEPEEITTPELIATSAELNKLLGEYLDNYRKLHKELNSKKDDEHAPKLKSAM